MMDVLNFDQGLVIGGAEWYKHVGVGAGGDIFIVSAVTGMGGKCVEFNCPKGDNREQLLSPWTLNEGDGAWFGWLMQPQFDFKLAPGEWQVLAQLHQNGIPSQPPVALLAYGTGRYGLEAIGQDGTTKTRRKVDLGEIKPGVTERWAVYVKRSKNAGGGSVVVYRGEYHPGSYFSSPGATSYDVSNSFPVRFEVGLYGSSSTSRTIYMDDFRRGASVQEVAPEWFTFTTTPAPPPPPPVDPCADLRKALQEEEDVNFVLRDANKMLIVERDAAVDKLRQAKNYIASL